METAVEPKSPVQVRQMTPRSKGMTTMISKFRHMLRRLGETDRDETDAWRDPLSHPAIRSMSSREVADLPFPAGYGRKRK